MNISFEGKVVIVTGSTSGIGAATAEAFAKAGADVIVCGRREDKGTVVVEKIKENGGKAVFIQTDVSDDSSMDHLVEEVVKKYGKIDVLVNNAGVYKSFAFEQIDMEKEYEEVFTINVRSYIYLSKLVLKYMLKQKSGNIINISSVGALNGGPGIATYCASKGAILQLTRSMAKEFGSRGIRVNSILPGLIHTEMMPEGGPMDQIIDNMIPLKRAGESQEIAHPILFICSQYASFINGASIVIDGGQSA
ncbi:hypothetical protein UAW_00686 [Enterococcus haemoperoxidus ATCC BAA-382]|uniref:Ketoreductase domain-containing protein n=1 Tax=Enterococcus haemoperoxidus ATCC BAA-382 TaxID=1158608 RepID=R2THE5_9ENTE|nr:SDR family oxidoreductase [Enterococcus haemoperoxidus]EOH99534.1 hypothetical protein UAW_00686 [Enterococcus haemoperoxidus ATCC BAA-382]EOT62726.1 hypothetical protein I583_01727 [Enterococcus haemoperoxidus ATCC BAA-382]OJG55194.1 hypothetical protein RV06_GL002231 [Enterococcus haemoperoxidus]